MSDDFVVGKNINSYVGPAGGWGALSASVQTLKQERAINALSLINI